MSRQAGNAAFAAATAAPTSSALANGARRITSPVAGSNTSPARPLVLRTGFPPIHRSSTGMGIGPPATGVRGWATEDS